MKCPHCQTEFFETWQRSQIDIKSDARVKGGGHDGRALYLAAAVATCPKCNGATVNIAEESTGDDTVFRTHRVIPRGGSFPAPPSDVPGPIAQDYSEANEVLEISPKASAALSRRCLQAILAAHGYSGKNLVKQVDAVIAESDTTKALPTAIRENIDAIRNFGNFSAHPITDINSLQIIEVEEGEAEWCLEILNDLFEHYYVAPAHASARRVALATKLSSAGKPPMKG